MAKKFAGPFVRFEVDFLLNDARYMRLSDGAQATYLYLQACALRCRSEFLPPEYDIAEIAMARRREEHQIAAALDELTSGPRALIGVLPDGRYRVVGVRDQHGDRFRWRDERDDAVVWNEEHADDNVDVESFAETEIAGRGGKRQATTTNDTKRSFTKTKRQQTTSADVDVDVDSDIEAPQPPRAIKRSNSNDTASLDGGAGVEATSRVAEATSRVASTDDLHGVAGRVHQIISAWDSSRFVGTERLHELIANRAASHDASDAQMMLAHTIDVGAADARCRLSLLLRRLCSPRYPPSDWAMARAKQAMQCMVER
jgi:hypothetical protein